MMLEVHLPVVSTMPAFYAVGILRCCHSAGAHPRSLAEPDRIVSYDTVWRRETTLATFLFARAILVREMIQNSTRHCIQQLVSRSLTVYLALRDYMATPCTTANALIFRTVIVLQV